MRHILLCFYSLSILFLFWILFASIISIDTGTLQDMPGNVTYSPAFSTAVVNDFNLKVFGSVKNMMIIVSSVGLVIQIPLLYKIFKIRAKNSKSKTYRSFLLYAWLGLFSPYITLFLLTSF